MSNLTVSLLLPLTDNVFTFLPLAVFGQFKRPANVYFLVIVILMLIGGYFPELWTSPFEWSGTVVPLVIVVGVSVIIEA